MNAEAPEATDAGGLGLLAVPPSRPSSPEGHLGVGRAPSNPDVRLMAEVVSRAVALAEERGEVLGTEHFLLALADQDSTKASEIMERHGLTRAGIESILDAPAT